MALGYIQCGVQHPCGVACGICRIPRSLAMLSYFALQRNIPIFVGK